MTCSCGDHEPAVRVGPMFTQGDSQPLLDVIWERNASFPGGDLEECAWRGRSFIKRDEVSSRRVHTKK